MTRLSRRTFVAAAGAAALAPAALAAPRRKQAEPLVLNDASRLNPTPVARNVMLRGEDDALIAGLRALLKDAAAEGRPVCIGGARHSMGGQSLCAMALLPRLAAGSSRIRRGASCASAAARAGAT